MGHSALFINGQWVAGEGEVLIKVSPLDQSVLWRAATASTPQVAAACLAAQSAQPGWADHSLEQRSRVINEFAALLSLHKPLLAQRISEETSKPLWESLSEVDTMIAKANISITAWHQRTGESEFRLNSASAQLRHRPQGVIAVFGPYNLPGHLPNGHILPALLAGNSVVFKPSELTPGTAELVLSYWQQAGLPPGVINLLQGGPQVGQALLLNPWVNAVLFTGGTVTGQQFHRQLAQYPEKLLVLEMGGNNALIVDQVSDIEAAVNLILQSAFISAGQRCTCARRLLVKSTEQGDQLIQGLIAGAKRLRVGDWRQPKQPFMGGVISLTAAQRILKAQSSLLAQGAKPLLTVTQPDAQSTLLTPGIIEVTGLKVADEEWFGPLLTLGRYREFAEAIELANQTRYGLAVGLLSPDKQKFDQLTRRAKAGIVNWNMPLTGASSQLPFGGVGASGNHRPSAFYAADYCAWPLASLISDRIVAADPPLPGLCSD